MKVVALISGGKDSCFNMMHCVSMGHEIVALANLQPNVDAETDSYMYQTVGYEGIDLYAKALQLPLFRGVINGSSISTQMSYDKNDNDEVEDLFNLLKRIKEEIEYDAISCGAILSDYQRIRVENVCQRLNLCNLSYLWRKDQQDLMQEMIDCEVDAVIIKVAALGLKKEHLGKSLKEMQQHLTKLSTKFGCHICGEGGEYETFTLDCPLFKSKIVIDKTEMVLHSDDFAAPVAYLQLKELHLEGKKSNMFLLEKLAPKIGFPKELSCTVDNFMKLKVKSPVSEDAFIWNEPNEELQQSNREFVKSYGNFLSVGNIIAYNNTSDSTGVHSATRNALERLVDILKEHGHSVEDVCYVHLFIANMANFGDVNKVYKQFFNQNPPARVCVSFAASSTNDAILTLDCISCANFKVMDSNVMHVQSISHWAPANIGPYSQCVQIKGNFFVAGQIGLVPGNMEILSTSFSAQASLAAKHVESVLRAMDKSLASRNIQHCICYLTKRDNLEEARHVQKTMLDAVCPTLFVIVPQLPKDCLVEWQVIASVVSQSDDCVSKNKLKSLIATTDLKQHISLWDTLCNVIDKLKITLETNLLDWTELLQIRLFYIPNNINPDSITGLCCRFEKEKYKLPSISLIPINGIYLSDCPNESSMAAVGLTVLDS